MCAHTLCSPTNCATAGCRCQASSTTQWRASALCHAAANRNCNLMRVQRGVSIESAAPQRGQVGLEARILLAETSPQAHRQSAQMSVCFRLIVLCHA